MGMVAVAMAAARRVVVGKGRALGTVAAGRRAARTAAAGTVAVARVAHFGEDHVFGHGDFGRGLADHHADIQRGHFFFRHHPISTGFSAPSPTPTKSY
jgi:hypothetical protein